MSPSIRFSEGGSGVVAPQQLGPWYDLMTAEKDWKPSAPCAELKQSIESGRQPLDSP